MPEPAPTTIHDESGFASTGCHPESYAWRLRIKVV
jgi:hypothetical protein